MVHRTSETVLSLRSVSSRLWFLSEYTCEECKVASINYAKLKQYILNPWQELRKGMLWSMLGGARSLIRPVKGFKNRKESLCPFVCRRSTLRSPKAQLHLYQLSTELSRL